MVYYFKIAGGEQGGKASLLDVCLFTVYLSGAVKAMKFVGGKHLLFLIGKAIMKVLPIWREPQSAGNITVR